MTPDEVVAALRVAGLRVGTAESLTGGLVCAALTDVPGASSVVRGGVVAYAGDVKASVLGVDDALLARSGTVNAEVASQMAQRARVVLGADVGVSTTGVAGPDPADGRDVGTVYLGAAGPWGILVEEHAFPGGRDDVRRASVAAALSLVGGAVRNLRTDSAGRGYGGPSTRRPDDPREEAP